MSKKLIMGGLLALGLMGGVAHPASAVVTTFGTLNWDTGGALLTYVNDGANPSNSHIVDVSIPVHFQFTVPNASGFIGNSQTIAAKLDIVGVVDGPAGAGFGSTVGQNFKQFGFTITANNAINGRTNLLSDYSVPGGNGQSTGFGGLSQANGNVNADTLGSKGVSYSSDFLSFTPPVLGQANPEQGFSFTFANVRTNGHSGMSINANGYLDSFTADGIVGNFYSDPSPMSHTPAPGLMAFMVSVGLSGAGFVKRRRK